MLLVVSIVPNEMLLLILNDSLGVKVRDAPDISSFTLIFFRGKLRYIFFAFWVIVPVSNIFWINEIELPSIIGNSGASTSIKQLSKMVIKIFKLICPNSLLIQIFVLI